MRIAAIAAGLICSCVLSQAQAGSSGPGAIFNTYSFTQQTFAFDGTNSTVVGALNISVTLFPDLFNESDFLLDLVNTGSGTAVPGMQTLLLFDPNLPPGPSMACVGVNVLCTLPTMTVQFSGVGNFAGSTFTSSGTIDNGTVGITFATASSNFVAQASSAVPEPVSLVLLGTGLAALALSRREMKA